MGGDDGTLCVRTFSHDGFMDSQRGRVGGMSALCVRLHKRAFLASVRRDL